MTDHLVIFSAAAAERTAQPEGGPGYFDRRREIAARLKPTRRRLTIISALATGWLPWGKKWEPHLVLLGRQYSLCCGHSFGVKEAQAFVDAGLVGAGPPDRFARATLVITPAGLTWLQFNWR